MRLLGIFWGKGLQYSEFEKWVDTSLSIDLPDGSEIFIGDNTKKFSCKYTVVSKKIIITDAENISRLIINSGIFHENADVKKLLGEKNRNLVGTHIKYNPISGNYIYCYFEF